MGQLLRIVALAAALSANLGVVLAQSDQVGVTAAVNPQASGTPPQQPPRELNVGLNVLRNEKVATGPRGKTQMVFLDGSALTVGPSAEVVLDEFVYDPATGSGKLAMTASKGVLRVVGGRLSKTDPIVVRTPTATLGIRGGIALISPAAYTFLFGDKLTVTAVSGPNAGQTVEITRRGTTLPLGPDGSFQPLRPATPADLAAALGGLEGDRGQAAGATELPTDERVSRTELADLGSKLPPQVTADDAPAAGGASSDGGNPLPGDLPDARILADASQLRPRSDGGSTSQQGAGVTVTAFGGLTGRYKSTPGSGNAAGTAGDGSAAFDRAFDGGGLVGDLFRAAPGGDAFFAPVNPNGGFLSYGSSEAGSPFGPISGTSFISPNRDFLFFESIETNFDNERSFLFAGVPTPAGAIPTSGFGAWDIRRDFVADSNIPFIPASLGGSLPGGTISPAYVTFDPGIGGRRFLQGSLVISGSGDTQSSAFSLLVGTVGNSGALDLVGAMRGSSRLSGMDTSFFVGPVGFSLDPNGNGVFGSSGPDYFVLESAGAAGRGVDISNASYAGSSFFPNVVASRTAALGVGADRFTGTMLGFINGVSVTRNPDTSTVVSPIAGSTFPGSFALATFAPLNSVFAAGSVGGQGAYTLYFGDGDNSFGRSAFIDDRRFGAIESNVPSTTDSDGPSGDMNDTRLYLVSGELAQVASILPSGVSTCTCSFMRWGFWGGDFTNALDGSRERIHLGQWVAGELAGAAEIAALSGTATYAGHAIADIINNGRVYKAGGGFGLTYDFTMRSGMASITNLDGLNYSGAVAPVNGLENAPVGAISSGPVSGPIGLAFYRNGVNPAAGVGGQFNVSNTGQTYRATGIVIGQQVPE